MKTTPQPTRPPIRKKVALQDSGLLLAIPEISLPKFEKLRLEYEQVDTSKLDAAIISLGKLTSDEQDLLSLFACLANSDTPEKRSWRNRLFNALEELLRLDTAHLPFVVAYARQIGAADTPGYCPITPFIDLPSSTPIPDGE